MKKYALILTCAAACAALTGCEGVSDRMSSDYPSSYDIKYGIRQVLQYDPMNINGIDVAEKFDFFGTLRFTIHVKDNRMASLEFSNGDVPFSPYAFEIPSGEVECYLDTEALPNELRIKGTDNVVAYFQNGEFSVPFQLDCEELNYKYTFKEIVE